MKQVCGWVCLFGCMSLCVCLCVCVCLSVSVCFCVVSDGYGMVLSHRTNLDKFGGQNSITSYSGSIVGPIVVQVRTHR